MKIEQLTLENFKCFKTEKTFDFSRLTILTGANSSGKSSVIYALLAILQSDDFPNELTTNGDYINLGDFSEISFNHDENNKIILNVKINDDRYSKNNIKHIIHIKTKWQNNKTDFLPELNNFESYSLINVGENNINESFRKNIDTDNIKESIRDIFFDEKFNIKQINYLSAFRQSPQRTYLEKSKGDFKIGTEGEGYLDQIVEWEKRSNGKIKELVKVMKDLNLIEDIKTKRLSGGRFEVLVKPVNSSVLTALSNVGFGISQFLPVIVADLQLSDDSTLFLAEPEIHLHPSVQSKFGEYIVKQINNTRKDYVIETHSEYFLNRIRLAIVKGELKPEDIKVYFLENKNDDTDVYDIEFTKTGVIKNAPDNFFETYYADSMAITLNAFAE